MDGINDSKSHELTPIHDMNNSGLRMILMILGHELMALHAMNYLGIWIT